MVTRFWRDHFSLRCRNGNRGRWLLKKLVPSTKQHDVTSQKTISQFHISPYFTFCLLESCHLSGVANKLTINSTVGNQTEILSPVLLEHEAIMSVIRTRCLVNGRGTNVRINSGVRKVEVPLSVLSSLV